MKSFRAILESALRLASDKRPDDALMELENGLSRAQKRNNKKWTANLAKNAALIHDGSGNLHQAKTYYRIAARCSNRDASLVYMLGDVCERLGDQKAAMRHFGAAFRLAHENSDEDLIEILEQRGFQRKKGE